MIKCNVESTGNSIKEKRYGSSNCYRSMSVTNLPLRAPGKQTYSENSKKSAKGIAQRPKQRGFRKPFEVSSLNQPKLKSLPDQSKQKIILHAKFIKRYNDTYFDSCHKWYKTLNVRIKAKFPQDEETGVNYISDDCPVLRGIVQAVSSIFNLRE